MCCFISMNLKGLFHDFNPSKFIVFFSLLLFSILLGFRLDGVLEWNYFIVFVPLWLWKLLVFSGALMGAIIWTKHPEYRRENNVDLQAMFMATLFHLFLFVFEVLLCANLQYNITSYRVVFVPIYCMSAFSVIACVWGCKRERQLELETFFLVNTLQLICLSLKWDDVITWNWIVVFVPSWITLTLLCVGVVYYIVWTLVRGPELPTTQRNGHLVNSSMSFLIVIPLLVFLVILARKLDGYSSDSYYTSTFIPLYLSLLNLIVTSFYQKGGNQWWFGMRKDFCEFLLDTIPLLREYGNISYKFSDAVVINSDDSSESDSSIEASTTSNAMKMREANKPVASVIYIDVPD